MESDGDVQVATMASPKHTERAEHTDLLSLHKVAPLFPHLVSMAFSSSSVVNFVH
jgi:hypothetical protein